MGQIVSIQYLRGIAALAVTYNHAFENRFGTALRENANGIWGVDIFFVISGFIMWTTTADGHADAVSFWKKRAIRIYPIYWIALSLWIVGRFVIPDRLGNADVSMESVLRSYLLLPQYHLVFTDRIWPILVPGWTLQFEVFFYFVFGLFLHLNPASRRALFTIVSLLILSAFGAYLKTTDALISTYSDPLLLEFGAGIVLGVSYLNGVSVSPRSAVAAIALSLTAIVICEFVFQDRWRWIVLGGPALLLVFGCLSMEKIASKRPMGPLVALGDASYSLYLFHPIVMAAVAVVWARLVGGTHPVAFVFTAVIVSVAAGLLVHQLVERPLIRHFRPVGTATYLR